MDKRPSSHSRRRGRDGRTSEVEQNGQGLPCRWINIMTGAIPCVPGRARQRGGGGGLFGVSARVVSVTRAQMSRVSASAPPTFDKPLPPTYLWARWVILSFSGRLVLWKLASLLV